MQARRPLAVIEQYGNTGIGGTAADHGADPVGQGRAAASSKLIELKAHSC